MPEVLPPVAPKEESSVGNFFSRWLHKVKDNPLNPGSNLPEPSHPQAIEEEPAGLKPLDLDEIRTKLGLEDGSSTLPGSSIEENKSADQVIEENLDGEQMVNDDQKLFGNDKVSPEVESIANPSSPWTLDNPESVLFAEDDGKQTFQNAKSNNEAFSSLEAAADAEAAVSDEMATSNESSNNESLTLPTVEDNVLQQVAAVPVIGMEKTAESENPEILVPEPDIAPANAPVLTNPLSSPTFEIKQAEISENVPEKIQGLVAEHFAAIDSGTQQLKEIVAQTIVAPNSAKVEDVLQKQAAPGQQFILKSGEQIASLKELMTKLETMPQEVFKYHVTANKNDFATWVEDVLEHERLADDIRTKKAKDELLSLLREEEEKVKKLFAEEKRRDELERVELEKKADDLERAKDQLMTLKEELGKKAQELEQFKERLIQEINASVSASVDKALIDEKRKLEQERIKVAGMESKAQLRLKDLDKERQKLEKEKGEWSAERQTLEGVKEREKILSEKEFALNKREESLREKEAEARGMQEGLKEALSSFAQNEEAHAEELQKNKKRQKTSKVKKDIKQELMPGEEELRNLEAEILKKIQSSEKSSPIKFDLQSEENTTSDKVKDSSSAVQLQSHIARCRKLIDQNRLDDAKGEYNIIKGLFAQASLDEASKSLMYNLIRELYNDIHLALLV